MLDSLIEKRFGKGQKKLNKIFPPSGKPLPDVIAVRFSGSVAWGKGKNHETIHLKSILPEKKPRQKSPYHNHA
jgi:hypothetical protein